MPSPERLRDPPVNSPPLDPLRSYDRQLQLCRRAYPNAATPRRERRAGTFPQRERRAGTFPGRRSAGSRPVALIARLPGRYGPQSKVLRRAATAVMALHASSRCIVGDHGAAGPHGPPGARLRPAGAGGGGARRRPAGRGGRQGSRCPGAGREGSGAGGRPIRLFICGWRGRRHRGLGMGLYLCLCRTAAPAALSPPGDASMSDRSLIPAPGRRTVLRGSLLASAAIAVPRRSPPPLRSRSRAGRAPRGACRSGM